MTRVLFVCLGNICRSPTAEAVARVLGPEHRFDSAGTGDWHLGSPPHPPAASAAARRGYPAGDLRARQFGRQDFDGFDLIVAMDRRNVRDIEALRPGGNETPVRLLLDYAPDLGRDVPDPYLTDDYEGALDIVEAATKALLRDLQP